MPGAPDYQHRFGGFTLAELLIALAILAVIAVFAIPKVLQAQQEAQKKAILKETASVMMAATHVCRQTGELYRDSQGLYGCLSKRVNVIKACPTDFQAEGCYTPLAPHGAIHGGGLVLHSGATVSDIYRVSAPACANASCGDGWTIDYNGDKPPNLQNVDRFWVSLNYGTKAGSFSGSPEVRRAGEFWSADPLYLEVFSQ